MTESIISSVRKLFFFKQVNGRDLARVVGIEKRDDGFHAVRFEVPVEVSFADGDRKARPLGAGKVISDKRYHSESAAQEQLEVQLRECAGDGWELHQGLQPF